MRNRICDNIHAPLNFVISILKFPMHFKSKHFEVNAAFVASEVHPLEIET